MTALTASAVRHLPFTHRGLATNVTTPISDVPDDTWGTVTATITSVTVHGNGAGLRILLGLRAADGSTGVAHLDADTIARTPDFLRTRDVTVQLRGVARRLPGGTPFLAVTGICPA